MDWIIDGLLKVKTRLSRTLCKTDQVWQTRERLECGGFSTAFSRGRLPFPSTLTL